MSGSTRACMFADHPVVQPPASVEDVLAIQQLKARYAWFADSKYAGPRRHKPQAEVDRAAHAQASCFTADAVWYGGREFGAHITGRDALFQFFRSGPWRFALHYYVAPIIEVHGDTAIGRWRLWQLGIPRGARQAVLFAAVTSERYRRVRGLWLHSVVRFESFHFVRPVAGGGLYVVPTLA